jgi:hypothetical protein
MAKDTTIGIRVSKEYKAYIQKEAKRRGMSLTEFIQSHTEDEFRETKRNIQSLIERAKEQRQAYWSEAEKAQITKEFEKFVPEIVSDFIHPLGHDPHFHPINMLLSISGILKDTIMNLDSLEEENKKYAFIRFLDMGKIIADNLNKFKSDDKEVQKVIVSQLKQLIEAFVFYFTSMVFAKDSFVKIKDELDKTEKILINEIEGKRNNR